MSARTLTMVKLALPLLACVLLLSLPQPSGAEADSETGAADLAQPLAGDESLLKLSEPLQLDGASRYRTRAQQLVADLVAGGETDLDELVAAIIADHREVLDHVVINLAEQKLYECNADGEVLSQTSISSGTRAYTTPTGTYHVVNKAPKAYSEKYEAWMLHWMGLTADGGYGMHGLEGSSYERLLGRVASHGCIRLSRAYAKEMYGRVTVALPVYIVDDPELDLRDYEPLSRQAAVAMVLDVLSPADPWEIYY